VETQAGAVAEVSAAEQHAAIATFSATLPLVPERERVGLRLGTAFIEHAADLWPQGEPAATPEWIRKHAFDLLATLEQMFHIDQHGRADNLLRIPHRLLWLLDDLDLGTPLDGSSPPRVAR
jgi:hypothetical protein